MRRTPVLPRSMASGTRATTATCSRCCAARRRPRPTGAPAGNRWSSSSGSTSRRRPGARFRSRCAPASDHGYHSRLRHSSFFHQLARAMAVPLLDLRAQHAPIRDETVAAVMRIVDAQTFILGEAVVELERAVAALSHTKHAIGCANGTDAILLAMRALDIGRGDEVVTTPFTFFATAGTTHKGGATPVFVDIEPDTFNTPPAAAAAARTSRTKA